MNVTIITADHLVIVDGRPIKLSFEMAGEWAVQFNGTSAEVEYTDSRGNELIDAAAFQDRYGHLVAAHDAEAQRLDAEAAEATEEPAA